MDDLKSGASLALLLEKIAATRTDLISNISYETKIAYYRDDLSEISIIVKFPKYIVDDAKIRLYAYIKDKFCPKRITFFDGNMVIVYEK